tara:strand:- start:473 stop:667 length:195 start_codon:yes stop_codon:yes gene_type:complete
MGTCLYFTASCRLLIVKKYNDENNDKEYINIYLMIRRRTAMFVSITAVPWNKTTCVVMDGTFSD